MNQPINVRDEVFQTGARTLNGLGDDVRAQGQAAGQINMGSETFGLIGQVVAAQVINNAGVLAEAITKTATVCDEYADGLRSAQEQFTGQEINAKHQIDDAGRGLSGGR